MIIDFMEDCFCDEIRLSLDCLVRLYTTVYNSYSFEEVKRLEAYDDIYDVGNLLLINVQHAVLLCLRRPDIVSLKMEENLKNFFKMMTTESRVNQILDINSLYLTETIIRERKVRMDRRIVLMSSIQTEAHIFIKHLTVYILDLDFTLTDFAEYPNKKEFYLEDAIRERQFEPMLRMEVTGVQEQEDFLDSTFFWEYYDGPVEKVDVLILKFIMILRLYDQTIGLISDTISTMKLAYKEINPKTVFKVINDNMVKIILKIQKTVKKNKFEPFVKALRRYSPATIRYSLGLLVQIHNNLKRVCEETIFLSAILFYSNKEGLDPNMSKVMTTTMVNKIEPQKNRFHKDNIESIDDTILMFEKFYKEI